ncbi:hypothetical protein C0Q70_16484 [Pomacea canaliculata]|uniref:C2H2-type domain-containing protein n=1 Tax=Pomacea canaliculata TaxID=400727 RepID=A0A2T7NPX4_POMCA|nr:hypothetical protein C0Q70_16484 [Pomacea canaliculata]
MLFLPNGHPEPQTEVLSLTKPKPSIERIEPKEQSFKDQNGDSSRKTHKANKHGIFDRTSPPPFSGSSSTPPSGMPLLPDAPVPFEVNLPASPPQKAELSTPPWQQQQQQPQQQQMPKKDTPNRPDHQLPSPSSKKSEAEAAAEKKVTSLISAVMNSIPSSQSAPGSDSSKSSGTSGSGNTSTSKDPSMEDYCEICQKHFCNKYYLKKHKQDVHGIIPETGPTTTKRSRASSSLLDLPVVSSVGMGSPMMLPQPMVSMGGMPALPPGVMVLNPFLQQMTIIPTGNLPSRCCTGTSYTLPLIPFTSPAPPHARLPPRSQPHPAHFQQQQRRQPDAVAVVSLGSA